MIWMLCGGSEKHRLREYIPCERQSKTGYRTDATDTRVAIAICNLWQKSPRLLYAVASLRTIGKEAGVSHNTVAQALHRLHGWFVNVVPLTDMEGRGAGCLGVGPGRRRLLYFEHRARSTRRQVSFAYFYTR